MRNVKMCFYLDFCNFYVPQVNQELLTSVRNLPMLPVVSVENLKLVWLTNPEQPKRGSKLTIKNITGKTQRSTRSIGPYPKAIL